MKNKINELLAEEVNKALDGKTVKFHTVLKNNTSYTGLAITGDGGITLLYQSANTLVASSIL